MVKIISTVNADGKKEIHLVNSIEQNNALQKRTEEFRRKEIRKNLFDAAISLAMLIAIMIFMLWLAVKSGQFETQDKNYSSIQTIKQ